MSREIELKLALPVELASRLTQLPCIGKRKASADLRRIHYRATYFDTADNALARSRAALRIRREATGWVQTLKLSPVEGLGLTERIELNWPLPRFGLDLAVLEQSPLAKHSDWASLRQRLKRRFSTQFLREACELHWPDGTVAELAMDRGLISAGRGADRDCVIHELEIELLRGNSARLWELALDLSQEGPIVPLIASKAQRGYELLGDPPAPRKAKPVAPQEARDYAQVLTEGLSHALLVMHHNLRHAHIGDPEFIHQARVALRRFRSLLRGAQVLGGPSSFRKALQRLRSPLRMLGQRLGQIRDADVLAGDTLPRLRGSMQAELHSALDALREQAHVKRQAAYRDMTTMWLDPQMGRALLLAEHVVDRLRTDPDWGSLNSVSDLRQIAIEQLGAQHEALWQASRDLSRQSVERLHALRIQGKRMRYLLDFWAAQWPKSDIKPYRSGLIALIESLGAISDDATALVALQALEAEPSLIDRVLITAKRQRHQRLPIIAAALVELDLAPMPWRR